METQKNIVQVSSEIIKQNDLRIELIEQNGEKCLLIEKTDDEDNYILIGNQYCPPLAPEDEPEKKSLCIVSSTVEGGLDHHAISLDGLLEALLRFKNKD
jgi:hypothetical protein